MSVFQPGMLLTAGRLNAAVPSEWQTWTPAFSTTTGANKSTFGNSTVEGSFVVAGKMCSFGLYIKFGSTATFSSGSDNWTFSLPVTAAGTDDPLGYASLYTGSGSQAISGLARLNDASTMILYIGSAAAGGGAAGMGIGIVDALAPYTWASGDQIHITGHYQTA